MAFPFYYPIVPITYVDSPVIVDANQPVGYKWYESHPSSDMDVMAAPPCFSDQPLQILRNPVSHSNYYPIAYKPPDPPPLPPYLYTPQFFAPYMFVDGSNQVDTHGSNHIRSTDVTYISQLNGSDNGSDDALYTTTKWSDERLGMVGDGITFGEEVVDIQNESDVDAEDVEPQVFVEIPTSKSDSVDAQVSHGGSAGESVTTDTLDRIILLTEKVKHRLLELSPPSSSDDVIIMHQAAPNQVEVDTLAIQSPAVEVDVCIGRGSDLCAVEPDRAMIEPWNKEWDWDDEGDAEIETRVEDASEAVLDRKGFFKDTGDSENNSVLKEVNYVEGCELWDRAWEWDNEMEENGLNELKPLVQNESTTIDKLAVSSTVDSQHLDSAKQLLSMSVPQVFAESYGVANSGVITITSADKESRDKSGKEGGIANEEVLVPVDGVENFWHAHMTTNNLTRAIQSAHMSSLQARRNGDAKNIKLSRTAEGLACFLGLLFMAIAAIIQQLPFGYG